MAHLPRFEQRPTVGYTLGHALGRGCLTRSVLVNLVRLLAGGGLLVSGSILLAAGDGRAGVGVGLTLLVLVATLAYRPPRATPGTPADVWTPTEQHLARVVHAAESQGSDITTAIAAAGLTGRLTVDYGTTVHDARAICVSQRLRQAHQLTTGGSGSGKSKFIATQAAQGALLGSSLAVIDPHESLAGDILAIAAPILAQRGCILIWPGGPSRRIYPWNPLCIGPGRAPWQAADLVVGAVKRVWQLSDRNTYIIDVLKHTSWALAGAGWTLLEGARFLTDEAFRAYITERAAIPHITQWVAHYDAMNSRDRQALIQTTLVRLNRLQSNPHLRRLLGGGVTDPTYRAALQREGVPVTNAADLLQAINSGHHLFTVIPMRTLGEDQYLIAGLVQAALLAAALARQPDDPAIPELELYLDEAGAYASADGLGKILAQARKYKLSALVALQGLHQAEPALAEELRTNTAIKTIFSTDHPGEAATGAAMLFAFEPSAIKRDHRQAPDRGKRRESEQLQTYSPQEQHAIGAGHILRLPPRQYVLKIRGVRETPLLAVTPEYRKRYELPEATQLAMRRRVAPLVSEEQIDAELRARARWLEARGYQVSRPTVAAPSIGAASDENNGAGPLTIGGDDGE